MKCHPIEVIDACAAESGTGSKKRKRAHIEDWFADPDSRPREQRELWKLVHYAFNPWYNYFVTTVPGLNEIASDARKRAKMRKRGKMIFDTGSSTLGLGQQFETMFELLDKLKDRKLPPNSSESRAAILKWATYCNGKTIDAFRRILRKDLRWGMQETSINAIYAGWVPTFKVQLAQPFDETKLKFPCYVDPKFDGERCLAFITHEGDEADVTYFSRNGNQFFNYGCFDEDLIKLFKGEGCMVVDCEVTNRKGFQSLMKSPKYLDPNFDTTNLRLMVFDFMPQTSFESGEYDLTQTQRYHHLGDLFKGVSPQKVALVDTRLAKDWQEAEQIYEHFVDQGLEGIILKQREGTYEFKRSYTWMKVKPCYSKDLRVVGIEMGKDNKQWEGKCGSLVVEKSTEEGLIRIGVASGLTHYDHENITVDGDKIIWKSPSGELINVKGKLIEVVYDCETEGGSLRFPRIKRRPLTLIRDDKVINE